MTDDEKYCAVINNDEKFDGVFFYAVKSTGIFCKPSCKSKIPKRKNICFFNNAKDAIIAGYRPCKRCRSDLENYNPLKEIAQKVKNIIDDKFDDSKSFNIEINKIGLSKRRIVEIFKQEFNMTLKNYINIKRMKKARMLFLETDKKIIEIAYEIGFNNLSSFYCFFKKQTGTTPNVFRKKQNKKIM